ncbi:MAG: HDIG domain-containing protein [Candidatus Azobacteroides sp.]|nr:HDIG domain-containing protein [Candidatus Azobacteroides sp.]
MDPFKIINEYYKEGTPLYDILVTHSQSVAQKALEIAEKHPEMNLDKNFIYEAAMLHDIGIFDTDAPDIYSFGHFPYICHGSIGSEILMKKGYKKHAMVCERHTGTGISLVEIIKNAYPIPPRNMIPETMEEKLICFADKFFSKTKLDKEKSIEKIRTGLAKHGNESVKRFNEWLKLFLG